MSAGSYDCRPNCPNWDSRYYEIRMISHSYKSQNQRDHSSDEHSRDPADVSGMGVMGLPTGSDAT